MKFDRGALDPHALSTAAATSLVLGLASALAWFVWMSLDWPLVWDAPLMHYVAWRILEGATPYRDVFDMNFPGVYWIHMAVLRWLGSGSAAWRAVDLALTAAVGVVMFRIARPFGLRSAALGALLFAAYHVGGGAVSEGQRDLFLFFFLAAGTWAAARVMEARLGRTGSAFALGLCLGVAITVKPQGALYLALLVGALVVGASRTGKPWLRDAALAAAGAAIPVAAMLVWLVARGALPSFLELFFGFVLPIYAKIGRTPVWSTLPARHYAFLALLTALALFCAQRAWRRGAFGPRSSLLCLGLAYGVFNYVAQGKGWNYHLIPWVGFACLLATSELDALLTRGRAAERLALLAGLAGLCAGMVLQGVRVTQDTSWVDGRVTMVSALVSELRPCIASGRTVQVLDTSEGGIHALLEARIRQPTRFIYDFPLFFGEQEPYIQDIRAEFLRDLERAPPSCVVIFERGWPDGDYGRLDGFAALRDWLHARYALSVEQDGYRLYEERSDQASDPGL